ncbi:hypothetical protein IV73_GL001071 [Weissella kandleri]|uniref:PrgI family protein n=1 Tax=Weissella kandleri TaxID=1616 RepID=A0A0R2JK80_9LACO|nr:hypothetical protein [Weissella kandleri]KRN74794.1 hypothetical protein IV73_GL001071 [Weissella kandleri]
MSKQNDDVEPYTTFNPGRNIWRKMSKFLFLTGERLGVLGVFGLLVLITAQKIFPYNLGWQGVVYIICGFLLTIFLVLPAPSHPNQLMWREVTMRNLNDYSRSIKVDPLDWEE